MTSWDGGVRVAAFVGVGGVAYPLHRVDPASLRFSTWLTGTPLYVL